MKLRIKLQEKTYDVEVEILDAPAASATPAPAALSTPAPRSAPIAAASVAAAPLPVSVRTTDKVVKAPIPGNIVRVAVAPGHVAKIGETLVVLEAMKMETPITSPTAGTVKTVYVERGTAVKQGQILVDFE